MVTLANDWAHLTPAARRERLAAIGPADLARLRRLSDLQPDLAKVLDDLEQRGVLPPASELESTTESPQELLVDSVLNAGESALHAGEEHMRTDAVANRTPGPSVALNSPTPLPEIDWPTLNLGLPSADEVLAEEAERRQQAATAAEAALQRVRDRVQQATARLTESRPAVAQSTPVEQTPVSVAPSNPGTAPSARLQAVAAQLRASDSPVMALDHALDARELAMLGEALALPVTQFSLAPGTTRQLFGSGDAGVAGVPRVGPLPAALYAGALVMLRGRPNAKTLARWRAGFCDIPGGRASVPLHPGTRVLLVPRDTAD
jgi:hypothetical protein